MYFDQITLPNGLRIIGEQIDHCRSVALGLWVGNGSRFETPGLEGMSHFIEHMVFKGTEHRSARRIAEEMDEVGGHMNAFTSRECTCFYTRVVDEHLRLAMDVISDLVVHPVFDKREMEKEKGVVLEEIDMSEDTPEDAVNDLLMLAHYGAQPAALPVLGNAASVRSFTREQTAEYWGRMYRPENAVLAVAGHYEMDELKELAEEYLGGWEKGSFEHPRITILPHTPETLRREKDIEQANLCLGFPGLQEGDERSYEMALFCAVYGGSMSSRLFQKIREEHGLAYSVYCYASSVSDSGMISVYAAVSPENTDRVCDLILEETRQLARDGITAEEFRKAREQLKSGFILGQESTSARMQAAGHRLLTLGNTRTADEIIRMVNGMELDRVNELTKRLLSAEPSCALISRGAEKPKLIG